MNSPAGTSTIGTSSLPVAGTGVGVAVGAGVSVGCTTGLGVAVGAACMTSAWGSSVGSFGAGGVTVGSLLTSHVATTTRAGDEMIVRIEVSVGVGKIDGANNSGDNARLTAINNNPNPMSNQARDFGIRRSLSTTGVVPAQCATKPRPCQRSMPNGPLNVIARRPQADEATSLSAGKIASPLRGPQ